MFPTSIASTAATSSIDASGALRDWLRHHRRIVVLTGAGISTASGIPDYRGSDGVWKRRAPVTYQQFMRDPALRARYWARSFVGWPVVARAQPNGAHAALVELAARGVIERLITQNVDGLHTRAGQENVIDLHGRIGAVICMGCHTQVTRAEIQQRLADAHPEWANLTATAAPDGDADIERIDFSEFMPPACHICGGLLKPDVVFFGENVPRDRVVDTRAAIERADAMLVVGSSLMVYSGFRFARMASERGIPLAILTRGVTRADDLATLKLDADCESTLTGAVRY